MLTTTRALVRIPYAEVRGHRQDDARFSGGQGGACLFKHDLYLLYSKKKKHSGMPHSIQRALGAFIRAKEEALCTDVDGLDDPGGGGSKEGRRGQSV